MSTVFLTVGSTLFPSLTDTALSPALLEQLVSLGITGLTVQYGAADIVIPPAAQEVTLSGRGDGSFSFAGSGEDKGKGIQVRLMRYTSEFESEIKRADMVVSHAGSGSILATLRARKPLLVIPNNSLMDDHQSELAQALQREGYLSVSSVDCLIADFVSFHRRACAYIAGLSRTAQPARQYEGSDGEDGEATFTAFPEIAKTRFASILDDVAGFDP